LEGLSIRLASRQQTIKPNIDKIQISVFAGDHGIANENVSAFPQVVTAEMVKNFASGGAAITVLAQQHKADFEIIDVGVAFSVQGENKVVNPIIDNHIANGTKNFVNEKAMSSGQLQTALKVGENAITRAKNNQITLFIGGEMGIANTTSASAILAAVLNKKADELTGAGTGIENEAIKYKAEIIQKALDKHQVNEVPPKNWTLNYNNLGVQNDQKIHIFH
jgi:nicotinate-nucleotide--dimethylbenzimidazole phosphoribosyltransferase